MADHVSVFSGDAVDEIELAGCRHWNLRHPLEPHGLAFDQLGRAVH